MRSVVDSYDESKVQALEIQMKAQQERLLSIQDGSIRINEKHQLLLEDHKEK
jgi:hypothetical protein